MRVTSAYGRVVELRLLNKMDIDTDNDGRVTGTSREVNQARVVWSSGKEGFYDADVPLSVGDVLVVMRVPKGGQTEVHQEVNAVTGDWWKRRDPMGALSVIAIIMAAILILFPLIPGVSPGLRAAIPVGVILAVAAVWLPIKRRNDADAATDAEYKRLRGTPEFQTFLGAGKAGQG